MKRWNRRILSEIERIASRTRELSLDPSNLNGTIHQLRRMSKNIRSLIKLISPKPCDDLQQIQLQLRQISRKLSPYRDQVVFIQTISRLRDRVPPKKLKAVKVLNRLVDEQASQWMASEQEQSLSILVQQAMDDLQQAARSLEVQLIGGKVELRSKIVFANHLIAWRKLRRRAKGVHPESPIERWHDLRKAAKCLEYQLKLLRKFSIVNLNKSYLSMEKVGNHLGWFNDLAKASEFIEAGISSLGNEIPVQQEDKDRFELIIAKYSRQSRHQAMVALKGLLAHGKQLRGMKSGDVIF